MTNAPDRPEGGVQAHINAYWDSRGPAYDAQPGHGIRDHREHRAWLEALTALLPPAPSDVVDVGTGTGFLALLVAELGHRVVGVDLSEGMLAEARTKASALPRTVLAPQFRPGDAVSPPLPLESVDVVISRHVLWTLPDVVGAFSSWRRLLRPGGRVVVIDGLWKLHTASGTAADPDSTAASSSGADDWKVAWARHYSAEVQAHLPLFNAETLDPAIAAAKAAGFTSVSLSSLDGIERVERELDPERKPLPRYVLTARLS